MASLDDRKVTFPWHYHERESQRELKQQRGMAQALQRLVR